MAEAKTISIMKGELTISPDAFYTLVKLKEELEDVIETIEIMNEKQKRLHQTFLQAKTFTKKMLKLLFCKQKPLLKNTFLYKSFKPVLKK